MTDTQRSGGVPEQGLREAAQQVLDESGPDISASLGALEKLRAALARPTMGYAYLHSPLCSGNGVAPNPGCSCGVVREMYEAALERPRPALSPDEYRFPCGCRVWREEDHALSTRTCEAHHALWLNAQPTMGASGANGSPALPAPEER